MDNSKRGSVDWIKIYRKYGIVFISIVLFVICAVLNENFLKPQNLINILKQITIIAIIGSAETILFCSGMVDLSAGYLCALTGCVAASVLQSTSSVVLAFAAGIACGAVVGYLNGGLITAFGLPPFIATLASANAIQGVTYLYTKGAAVTNVEQLAWLGRGRILGVPVMVILMLGILVLIQIMMKTTKLGLYMYSIGGNENASMVAGINVNRYKRIIFSISGAIVGIGGIIMVARMMSAQPNVGPGYEFDGITATIVGGTSFTGGVGSAAAVIIGSIIIGLINNILNLMNVGSEWQMISKGVLIALAVALDLKLKSSNR